MFWALLGYRRRHGAPNTGPFLSALDRGGYIITSHQLPCFLHTSLHPPSQPGKAKTNHPWSIFLSLSICLSFSQAHKADAALSDGVSTAGAKCTRPASLWTPLLSPSITYSSCDLTVHSIGYIRKKLVVLYPHNNLFSTIGVRVEGVELSPLQSPSR